MTDTNLRINDAIRMAADVHGGQTDKGGQPYVLHPLRVMHGCKSLEAKIVAVLHDVAEDTDVTLEQLSEQFGPEVGLALEHLTKRPGDDYARYIDRIAKHRIAREVKIQDIKDNMDVSRLPTVGEQDVTRLEKYRKALLVLQKANEENQPESN